MPKSGNAYGKCNIPLLTQERSKTHAIEATQAKSIPIERLNCAYGSNSGATFGVAAGNEFEPEGR
jgi:hypothetical protein